MGEREIVRKEGFPVAFKGSTVQYIRCGKKCNPQIYTPSFKPHKLRCGRSHKRCEHD